MSNCGHKVKCGCGDQPLATPPPCNTEGACEGEPCSELFCEECIVHCQPEISYSIGGRDLIFEQGFRMDEMIQKLMIFLENPTLVDDAAIGLRVTDKGTDYISLRWSGDSTYKFKVHWVEGANLYEELLAQGVLTYKIEGLIPDTEYAIRVETDGVSVDSVTMKVKTLST